MKYLKLAALMFFLLWMGVITFQINEIEHIADYVCTYTEKLNSYAPKREIPFPDRMQYCEEARR